MAMPELLLLPTQAAPAYARPSSGPKILLRSICEIALQGASVYRVNGLIDDCGKLVAQGRDTTGWFDVSTLKEPYRIETKTMGLELAEQLAGSFPM